MPIKIIINKVNRTYHHYSSIAPIIIIRQSRLSSLFVNRAYHHYSSIAPIIIIRQSRLSSLFLNRAYHHYSKSFITDRIV